jgi:hypothetical protein
MFERGINGTVNEFPRFIVVSEDVVPESLARFEIDVREFLFLIGLTQHRPEFRPGDADTHTWL